MTDWNGMDLNNLVKIIIIVLKAILNIGGFKRNINLFCIKVMGK